MRTKTPCHVVIDRGQEPRPTVTSEERVHSPPELAAQRCPSCGDTGGVRMVKVDINHPWLIGGEGVWIRLRCERCDHVIPPGTWSSAG